MTRQRMQAARLAARAARTCPECKRRIRASNLPRHLDKHRAIRHRGEGER